MAMSRRVKDERVWNISPEAVAKQTGRSVWTARRWMKSGQLDYWQTTPGGPMMTCQEALNDFIHQHLKRAC